MAQTFAVHTLPASLLHPCPCDALHPCVMCCSRLEQQLEGSEEDIQEAQEALEEMVEQEEEEQELEVGDRDVWCGVMSSLKSAAACTCACSVSVVQVTERYLKEGERSTCRLPLAGTVVSTCGSGCADRGIRTAQKPGAGSTQADGQKPSKLRGWARYISTRR